MKFSETWLREWVEVPLSREEFCDRLTMTGLEVDSLEPVAEPFSQVVIGKLLQFHKHPEADHLQVCEVDVGQKTPLTIVCGATNLRLNMKAPVAMINAILPNKLQIKETLLRGVTSQGMLCSAFDLGLAEVSEGLFELQKEAPVGADVWEYLQLTDHLIEVAITPNRGDCLSVKGLARELAAVTQGTLKKREIPSVKASIKDVFPVTIEAKTECPRYVGRLIRGVKAEAETPLWMKEKLRRSGIRSISALVDITNYVMLELGQPMHAFDLARFQKKIVVRMARKEEELVLLDGRLQKLDEETLVIADQEKPLAIAGVMGGLDSGINLLTQDLFLESAFFTPTVVSRQRQKYQLNSESSFRFERGVDPDLQVLAMERATRLVLDIAGGEAGPLIDNQSVSPEWSSKTVTLSRDTLFSLLGCRTITEAEVSDIFERLGFKSKKEKNQQPAVCANLSGPPDEVRRAIVQTAGGPLKLAQTADQWQVQVPSWRFDVTREEDLIEEVARLYGYDKIAPTRPSFAIAAERLPENQVTLPRVRRLLCDLGYHEVVTYSFVNKEWQALLDPEKRPKALVNPITVDMTVMRTNLWPGLLGAYLYNRDRQQERGRFFETGLCFTESAEGLAQRLFLGGLVSGAPLPEQWGEVTRKSDFFDLKGDVEKLLQLTRAKEATFHFKPGVHPALHPGQTAGLFRGEEPLGLLGALHPALRQKFDILEPIFLFEFNLEALLRTQLPTYTEISRFPEIRRDLALLVDRHLPSEEIQATIVKSGGEWLRHVKLFDVYLGEGVPKDKKSVAFALTLQHATRTLRDEEVVETVDRIIRTLQQTWGIELRG